MGLSQKINEYRDYIIALGLLVGGAHVIGLLPDTVEFMDLGPNIKFVYLGSIAIAIGTFHHFYWKRGQVNFQRTVQPRNLSNPDHYADLMRQRGTSHSQPPPQINIPTPGPGPTVSEDIWAKFKRE